MNNAYILNWKSTRIEGFLDACVQGSKILVPLLDTIIKMKIRPDERTYINSMKGLFLLELLTDLRTFGDGYLHKVDSDKNLCHEAFRLSIKTVLQLKNIPTPKATNNLERQ